MKNTNYYRSTNFQAFRRRGIVPGDYDKSVAWFEQHPYFYVRVAKYLVFGLVATLFLAWILGVGIDSTIDDNNRRSCDLAFHNESISHPVVQNCLEYYQTGSVEYLR